MSIAAPAGEKLTYQMMIEQDDKMMRHYWTNACPNCSLKSKCRMGNERRIPRWEHEHVLEAVQQRLYANPQAMPRLKPGSMLLVDRGYDPDWIRTLAHQHGAWANIPPRSNRK